MKKFLFFLVVAICLATVVFAGVRIKPDKPTPTEIANAIPVMWSYNQQIADPDWIFPGQVLIFIFQDGLIDLVTVEQGDCLWTIIRDKLAGKIAVHGPIVNYYPQGQAGVDPMPTQDHEPDLVTVTALDNFFDFLAWVPWWVWLIVGFCLWAIVSDVKDKRNVDPITAGTPQVPGGVTDQKAYERLSNLAAQHYPGARIEIKKIRRGRLSGLGKVFYANGKSKKINLKGIAAYAGEILVNGNEQTIYFLQGCGNDARDGNYMSGSKFIFTPDVVINKDGSESPLPIPDPEAKPTVSEIPVNPGSESHQQRIKILDMAKDGIKQGKVHEFTAEENQGTFRVNIKYKTDADPKKPVKSAEKNK